MGTGQRETRCLFHVENDMNKRQAKKKRKNEIAYKNRIRSAEGRQQPSFFDADIDRNGEGYSDPTAGAAIRKLTREGH